MPKLRPARNERGVSTILVAIMMTCIVAAAGLSIDSGSLAYQRSRMQHSADAAAMAIGYDCVADATSKCNVGYANGTASYYATQNSEGGSTSIPSGLTSTSNSVQVRVDKTISTKFFGAVGIHTKNESARASAAWSHAVRGNVLPFLVSLCQYTKSLPVGTATFFRTDMNDFAKNNFAKKAETTLNPYLDTCTVPSGVTNPGLSGSIKMLQGGLWESLTGNNVCNGKIELSIFQTPPDAQAANEGCTKGYSTDIANAPDGVLLLAIYAPSVNYQFSGVRSTAGIVGNPPTFGIQIVGFAPFKVSGWCLGQPLACGGTNNGTEGIAGKFLNSSTPIADVEYGNQGGAFGAYKVDLTQ